MKYIIVILVFLTALSCSKDKCWNAYGDEITSEVSLEKSYDSIFIGKGLEVQLTQDSSNFVEVISGSKIYENIVVSETENTLRIENENKCNFMRSYDKKTIVNIHQKTFDYLYLNTEKDLTCTDTIRGERLLIYQEHGGGEMDIKVNCNYLKIVSYNGSGNFIASGVSDVTEIITRVGAYGDARNLISESMHVTNFSKDDLLLNFEGANVSVAIHGTGNIIYSGTPNSLNYLPFNGVGACLPE